MPSNNISNSILEIIQQNVTLRFALYGGLLFFVVQIALSRIAQGFSDYRWYSFFCSHSLALRQGVRDGPAA